MKIASLFDGIGGALLCAERCGVEAVWSSEIEPFPIKVTEYHFPHAKHLGDITKIKGDQVEPVDIIIGGSPCQDLSVAGLRKGMKHSDFGDEETTRSGLFMEQIRIVKEMRNASDGGETNQPRFMVWENVPGAFSSNKGEDFRIVLEETARIKDKTVSIPRPNGGKWLNAGAIVGSGFSLAWRTVDAQYWGVPQRRRRIYLVADFGGESAPEILFEREGVSGDTEESRITRETASGYAQGRTRTAGGSDVTSTLFAAYGTKWNGNSGALTGDHFVLDDACGNNDKGKDGRSAGQGIAGDVEKCINSTKQQPVICLQGNGIDRADTAGCNGKGWTEGICYTLNTVDRPAVCFEPRSPDGYPRISNDGLCPTLNTMTGGQRQPCIAYDIGNGQADQDMSEEIAGTLNCMHDQRAIMTKNAFGEDVCGTLMARDYKGIGRYDTSDRMMNKNNTVRRLTPLECERLQGYPDNYTNIPGASDSARYKALGNSFAVPCAEFVIRGIAHYSVKEKI